MFRAASASAASTTANTAASTISPVPPTPSSAASTRIVGAAITAHAAPRPAPIDAPRVGRPRAGAVLPSCGWSGTAARYRPRETTLVSASLARGIDRSMPTGVARSSPRYRVVAGSLAAAIISGDMRPGERVPSERVIAERHGLSRMTARQAVELLVRRGLVYRRPGSGTYVAPARVEHTLQRFAGFSEQMRAQGIEPGGRVLAVRAVDGEAGSEVLEALGLSDGDRCWCVRRVRFGDGEPLVVEESHVPFDLMPGL